MQNNLTIASAGYIEKVSVMGWSNAKNKQIPKEILKLDFISEKAMWKTEDDQDEKAGKWNYQQ